MFVAQPSVEFGAAAAGGRVPDAAALAELVRAEATTGPTAG